MLFFQVVLVLGYAYSHLVTRKLSPRGQVLLHSVLLVVAISMLPIRPDSAWKPVDGHHATWRVLLLLVGSVGLQFFLVSTTGPLVQYWQSLTHPTRSPFRLFALSNAASMLALVSYPLLMERWFTLEWQSWIWSAGFVVFALLVTVCGVRMMGNSPTRPGTDGDSDDNLHSSTSVALDKKPALVVLGLWLVLPMLASLVLLATTHMMTQEIGSIPFLWVLPLCLYLLSFVICFDHPRWYVRIVFYPLFFGAVVFSAIILRVGVSAPISVQVLGYSALVFGVSMCCHGELARTRPSPRHLTLFYLIISIGGALGGVLVAIAAPARFTNYYEFPLGVLVAVLVTLVAYGRQVWLARRDTVPEDARTRDSFSRRRKREFNNSLPVFAGLLLVGLLAAGCAGLNLKTMLKDDRSSIVLLQARNEYGTLTVTDLTQIRQLTNGRIQHGLQYKDPQWAQDPTSYYCPTSGLGRAISYLRDQGKQGNGDPTISFGAIGLGVGTICAWCNKGDSLCYYEINPLVVEVSNRYFTYLSGYQERTGKPAEIRLGDARIRIEREIANGASGDYDILIADAFSSDSIPAHLLTLESMQFYSQRLTDRGILCVHTSNRFLELENVVRQVAEKLGMEVVYINDQTGDAGCSESSWVLVTRNRGLIKSIKERQLDSNWPPSTKTALWTDDYSPIAPLVRWQAGRGWWDGFLESIGWKSAGDEPDNPSD